MSIHSTCQALTPHEERVAVLVAEGYQTKQIAFLLNVSPKTIDSHRQSIMRKISVTNLAGIVRWAIRAGRVVV